MPFFEETEQTRLEAQVSKGKIGISEIVLQTWIFLNFLELQIDFFGFFFLQRDYFLLQFLSMADVNVTVKKEKKIGRKL